MAETLPGLQSPEPDAGGLGSRSWSTMLTHVFVILFCLEIGFVLILLPWTPFWDNNYFFSVTPGLADFWFSTYLRGAVSGLGLINLWIGVSEAWRMWQ